MEYFAKSLATNDAKLKAEPGIWAGALAKRLGIEGEEITARSFKAVMDGNLAHFGDEFGNRSRRSEIQGWDIPYSPPKSFAIAAAEDPSLNDLFRAVLEEELAHFESKIAIVRDARGRPAGDAIYRETEGLLVCHFLHNVNRDGYPGTHMHQVVANLVYDESRDGFFALHARRLLEDRRAFDLNCQAALAQACQEAGYTLRQGDFTWELAEVPDRAVELFSSRSPSIAEVRQEYVEAGYPRHQADQIAFWKTRPSKADDAEEVYLNRYHDIMAAEGLNVIPPHTLEQQEIYVVTTKDRVVVIDVAEQSKIEDFLAAKRSEERKKVEMTLPLLPSTVSVPSNVIEIASIFAQEEEIRRAEQVPQQVQVISDHPPERDIEQEHEDEMSA